MDFEGFDVVLTGKTAPHEGIRAFLEHIHQERPDTAYEIEDVPARQVFHRSGPLRTEDIPRHTIISIHSTASGTSPFWASDSRGHEHIELFVTPKPSFWEVTVVLAEDPNTAPNSLRYVQGILAALPDFVISWPPSFTGPGY